MIIPGKADIKIIQGATFDPYWIMKIDDVAVDLTGYTARMVIKKTVASDDALLTLTTENGGIVITAVEGKIALHASSTATAALNFSKGVYNLELIHSGITDRLLEGSVSLELGTNV